MGVPLGETVKNSHTLNRPAFRTVGRLIAVRRERRVPSGRNTPVGEIRLRRSGQSEAEFAEAVSAFSWRDPQQHAGGLQAPVRHACHRAPCRRGTRDGNDHRLWRSADLIGVHDGYRIWVHGFQPSRGSWESNVDFGNPAPLIWFTREADDPEISAQIAITAGGSPFTLTSADLYSSITTIAACISSAAISGVSAVAGRVGVHVAPHHGHPGVTTVGG
jgi:hypothetical protein